MKKHIMHVISKYNVNLCFINRIKIENQYLNLFKILAKLMFENTFNSVFKFRFV